MSLKMWLFHIKRKERQDLCHNIDFIPQHRAAQIYWVLIQQKCVRISGSCIQLLKEKKSMLDGDIRLPLNPTFIALNSSFLIICYHGNHFRGRDSRCCIISKYLSVPMNCEMLWRCQKKLQVHTVRNKTPCVVTVFWLQKRNFEISSLQLVTDGYVYPIPCKQCSNEIKCLKTEWGKSLGRHCF